MENENNSMMVAINCMTYNQKPYILDALNGFVIQKTSFPYIIILVDDASTDGEQKVIQDFIKVQFDLDDKTISYKKEDVDAYYTYARHKSNFNCYIIYIQLKKNLYGNPHKREIFSQWENSAKYIAFCEGDDYWIDSSKLQKQVDYLESNDDCCFCCTDCNIMFGSPKNIRVGIIQVGHTIINENNPILSKGYVLCCTWMWNRCWHDGLDFTYKCIDGSFRLLCEACLNTRIGILPDITAVYRRHDGSASCNESDIQKKLKYEIDMFKLRLHYAPKFPNSENTIKHIYTRALLEIYPIALLTNDKVFTKQIDNYFKDCIDVSQFEFFFSDYNKIINEHDNVIRSKAYKIGKFFTKPLSLIRKKLSIFSNKFKSI